MAKRLCGTERLCNGACRVYGDVFAGETIRGNICGVEDTGSVLCSDRYALLFDCGVNHDRVSYACCLAVDPSKRPAALSRDAGREGKSTAYLLSHNPSPFSQIFSKPSPLLTSLCNFFLFGLPKSSLASNSTNISTVSPRTSAAFLSFSKPPNASASTSASRFCR